MGILAINDLPESVDLDRQAMAAITGGSTVQSHRTMLAPQPFTGLRFGIGPGEIHRTPIAEAVEQRTRSTLFR
ncbi:hypothetical protein FAZ69_27090 [Trinickia terrae]|uniref:Uncharacterized protein n=1 Tax=Trinickia terrae TaxID=2571161 RepID=A0A4U1HQ39_9BURK|nr:hypothetical protein [Trinickia terrae]TKC81634.1 hypothetical protein FAZ69_27090 [Trinickia terrae]